MRSRLVAAEFLLKRRSCGHDHSVPRSISAQRALTRQPMEESMQEETCSVALLRVVTVTLFTCSERSLFAPSAETEETGLVLP
jgi:hypothetical protein